MQRSLCLLLVFFFVGCTSLPINSAIDRVQAGMDKDEVLQAAGNPKRTYREHGEDHWIYVFFERQQELSREVIFEAGKVIRVTKARAKTNWDQEIQGAAGFKDVDADGD